MTISATTRGLRPGVCTSTTRPGSPFDGQLIYETDTNRVAVYDTNTWVYKTPASTTGSVLQVVQTVKSDTFSSSSTSWVDLTGLSVSITPSSTSSKILVMMEVKANAASDFCALKLVRGSTDVYVGDAAGSRERATAAGNQLNSYDVGARMGTYLDSPNTTSSTTYKIQFRVSAGTGYVNRQAIDTDNSAYPRVPSSITVMEIAG